MISAGSDVPNPKTRGVWIAEEEADVPLVVETLTPVVAEEWDHFARVLAELKKAVK